MTICVAWVRKIKDCEELIFVSDSRLNGGDIWDESPKILPLDREDCAISFAGDTNLTYPLMLQIRNALNQFYKIKNRAMDITDLNGYLLTVTNNLFNQIKREGYSSNADIGNDVADLIFGGYSWINKSFKIWKYHYHKTENKFIKNQPFKNYLGLGNLIIAGDLDVQKAFKERLRRLIFNKYKTYYSSKNHFDMEPFEVIRDMLRDNVKKEEYRTIGGAPQMIKVYQYMNSRPVGIYWPKKDMKDIFGNRTLLGRKMLNFEDSDYWFMDPDTFYTKPCHKNI